MSREKRTEYWPELVFCNACCEVKSRDEIDPDTTPATCYDCVRELGLTDEEDE